MRADTPTWFPHSRSRHAFLRQILKLVVKVRLPNTFRREFENFQNSGVTFPRFWQLTFSSSFLRIYIAQ